jgi:hypothetical protein
MAVFLCPSSFRCDCGHECHFFENTVREMCKISKNKAQFLVEDGHCIEFAAGKAAAVHCPTLGRCAIVDMELE